MVKSIRNPNAPVRIFTATNDRCKCNTRIAQERMCIHEIKWKRRFKGYRFQPSYFRRDRVEGSLPGWEACTEIETNLMTEYQEDIMIESQNCSIVEESDVADVDAVALDHPNCSDLPPGYMHDTSNSIKPLDTKTLKLILLSVAGGYTQCSKEMSLQYRHLQYRWKNCYCLKQIINPQWNSSVRLVSMMITTNKK